MLCHGRLFWLNLYLKFTSYFIYLFSLQISASLIKCYMDETVDPCDKFYDYACGNWEAFHPIPRDRGGYDTFEILREDLDAKLLLMLQERISDNDNNATSAAKTLYASCMNTSKYTFHLFRLTKLFNPLHFK